MTGALEGLLGSFANGGEKRADLGLVLGTVTGLPAGSRPFTTAQVKIDGADTAVTVDTAGTWVTTSDRLLIQRLGRSLYVVRNLDADTGWIRPTLLNGWVDFDARVVQYRRINGVVYTEGIAKNGTVGQDIFNYPAGFRPTSAVYADRNLLADSNSAVGLLGIGGSDGRVNLTSGSNAWVDLAGIPPFPADN